MLVELEVIEVTFFDWPHLRIAPNHAGTGEISTTELRVSGRDALDWWAGRFAEHGVRHGGVEKRDGVPSSLSSTSRGSGSSSRTRARTRPWPVVCPGRKAPYPESSVYGASARWI